MDMLVALSLVAMVTAMALEGDAAQTDWRKYFRTPAKVYWRYYGTPMDWNSAQKRCAADGAHLAIADTSQKIHMLKRKLSYDAWIGLSKSGSQWKWIDGRVAANSNWKVGEPNGRGTTCVYSRRVTPKRSDREDGKWIDDDCGKHRGFVCEAKNKCVVENPCKNGGKCGGVDRSISCTCPSGFQGQYCEQDKRPCIAFNPCKHGARCTNKGLDYSCSCPVGIVGKNCEQDKRPCISHNPCKQGAHCTNRGMDYSCTCPAGFQGKNCEQDNRPCFAFNPCKQGARCSNRGLDYSCACPAGFSGKNCEMDQRPCIAFNPCQNKARCANQGLNYVCSCPTGFAGKNCEQDKRPCYAFNPCKNGGRCEPLGSGFRCTCSGGFKGETCEKVCAAVSKGGLPQKLDVVFLMDGSSSVGANPFHQGLRFINKIVEKMDISPNNGRVGFVQFAHKIRSGVINFRQSAAQGKAALEKDLLRTKYMGGATVIGKALNEAITMFKNDGRPDDVEKYVMVLSDGQSSVPQMIPSAVKEMAAMKIKTFAVAVGEMAKTDESRRQLREIAQGKLSHIFEVDDYGQLDDELLKKILVAQCD